MALGYTIAAILKRNSHVFSDERVCVKIDWLEQLDRHYVQVWPLLSLCATLLFSLLFAFLFYFDIFLSAILWCLSCVSDFPIFTNL